MPPKDELEAKLLVHAMKALKLTCADGVLITSHRESLVDGPYAPFNRLTGTYVAVHYLDWNGEPTSIPSAMIEAAGEAAGLVVSLVDEDGNFILREGRKVEIEITWDHLLWVEVY